MNIHGDFVRNVNLGAPYEKIIDNIISREYAGNATEAIRQALLLYQQRLDKEEEELVTMAVMDMKAKIESGDIKMHSLEETKKLLGID